MSKRLDVPVVIEALHFALSAWQVRTSVATQVALARLIADEGMVTARGVKRLAAGLDLRVTDSFGASVRDEYYRLVR